MPFLESFPSTVTLGRLKHGSLTALTYNLRRAHNILGVEKLMAGVAA